MSDSVRPAMREGWTRVALGDVAEIVGGGTPKTSEPSYWSGSIPWITPTEVVAAEGKVITSTARTITDLGLQKSGARLLPPSSVLVTSRATVGAVAITGCAMATNQGFAAFIAGPLALPEFLMIWCQANAGEFRMRAGGSTFPEISRGVVREIPIDLPPLDEQRRIVDLIGSLDERITAAETALLRAQQLRAAVVSDFLFAHTGGDSPWAPVAEISRDVTVGFVGSQSHLFVDAGIPLLRGTNVRESGLALEDLKYIPDDVHRLWRKSALAPGDVILVRVGYPGTACVVPEGLGECNAASLVIVRPHSDLVDAHYLALLFNSAWGKRTFQRLLVGGAQKVLNVTTVARLEVPVPPMAEQKRIVRVAAQIDAYGDRLVDVAANSRRIRQGLLQDLLSGAHEIPASYDRLLAA